jgi:hypothetical protein
MSVYLLTYRGADHAAVGFAIVEALDAILAQRAAEAANIHLPGAVRTADEIDRASVPAVLIGRRLTAKDFIVKKPAAPSAGRRAPAAARTA